MIRILFSPFEQEINEDKFQFYLSLLPLEHQKVVRRYHRRKDSCASLFGKLLLVDGLRKMGFNNLTLDLLRYTNFNRPYFNEDIDFNISHTNQCVVCVLSKDFKVGVDIEEIAKIDYEELKEQWTENEWALIKNSHFPEKQFYHFWTRKEAIIKADGRGLNIPLKDIDVRSDEVFLDPNRWFLREVNLGQKYTVALATSQPISAQEMEIERVSFQ